SGTGPVKSLLAAGLLGSSSCLISTKCSTQLPVTLAKLGIFTCSVKIRLGPKIDSGVAPGLMLAALAAGVTGSGSASAGAGCDSTRGTGELGSSELAPRRPPSPDVVELGFPPLMLTLAGAEPLPPSLGSGREPPVLEFPPRLPGPPPEAPPGTPGCGPSGEIETREARLPGGMGRSAGASLGDGEIATSRCIAASPPCKSRSEERRVGKERRKRRSAYDEKRVFGNEA